MANKTEEKYRTEYVAPKEKATYDHFQFLIAGFDGRIPGLSVRAFSCKRDAFGDFRLVLRGVIDAGTPSAYAVVAFIVGPSLAACLGLAEYGLAHDTLKWVPDKFAEGNDSSGNGANRRPPKVITLQKSGQR